MQLESDDPSLHATNAIRASSAHSGSLYPLRLNTMESNLKNKPSKKFNGKTLHADENGLAQNQHNYADETISAIENPNFLRIPLNPPSAVQQHHDDEIINEKRSVKKQKQKKKRIT